MKRKRTWTGTGKRCLLLVIPLLGLESCRAELDLSHERSTRNLKLECPVDEYNGDGETDKIEGRFDSYSTGDLGRSLVERMRSKPDSYYQSIVDNIIMLSCDVETASVRCVEETSPMASRDWAGECIKAADFECPSGFCERASNCYWKSVHEGQNRTTRFEPKAYKKASAALYGANNSYGREIVQFAVIGVAIGCILFLFWILFFVGRYLCCCLWVPCSAFCFLCSPIPKKDGYNTCRDIVLPACVYVLALIGICVAASMAFVGNEDISVALSNTFLHADGLVEDLRQFLGKSSYPLENIQDIVGDAALEARSIFDGTEWVKEDALLIVDSFLGYLSLHSEGLNTSNAIQSFDAASAGFDEKVGPITDNVQSMLDTLRLDLAGSVDTIKAGLAGALDQLESFSGQTVEWQEVIRGYEGQELGARNIRQAAVTTMFILSLFFAVFGFFGVFAKKRNIVCSTLFHFMKLTGFFAALLGSLSLIAASLLLCLNFALFDACHISDIVTSDFEPYVGDKISPGANACFNDTNLAVAFNVTEKVDFQAKLDEGLDEIEAVNVTEKFQLVLEPLATMETMLGSITDAALSALNQAISANEDYCPFDDVYTKENILTPWSLEREDANTPWIIRDAFGNPTTYSRVGSETPQQYLDRIYNKAGVCSAPSNCCIEYSTPSPTCESSLYANCDSGDKCMYPCEVLKAAILEGYTAYLQLLEKELAMTADLGISCPVAFDCPTQAFRSSYSNLTLVGLLDDYKDKITTTKDSLVGLAQTSVGDVMFEVEDFLCNMNVSFVERRYDEVKEDICGTLFGGAAQLMMSYFILGICLEVVAIVVHVLAVRTRSNAESIPEKETLDWVRSRAEIY